MLELKEAQPSITQSLGKEQLIDKGINPLLKISCEQSGELAFNYVAIHCFTTSKQEQVFNQAFYCSLLIQRCLWNRQVANVASFVAVPTAAQLRCYLFEKPVEYVAIEYPKQESSTFTGRAEFRTRLPPRQ